MEAINVSHKSLDNLIIRFATHTDLPQIAQIAHVTWEATSSNIDPENRYGFLSRAYQVTDLVSTIDAPGNWFYVCEVIQNVIAFGHFMRRYHPTQRHAELVRLYVLPEYQGMGVGPAILKAGFATLAKANIKRCSVSVQMSNLHARKLYEQHGFIYHRKHGQFLGAKIITLIQYVRYITKMDL